MADSVDKSIGSALEANIHRTFTIQADGMRAKQVLTRPERIALSSAVGDALKAFTDKVEASVPQVYERDEYQRVTEDGTEIVSKHPGHSDQQDHDPTKGQQKAKPVKPPHLGGGKVNENETPKRRPKNVKRDKSLRETGKLPAKPKRGSKDLDAVLKRIDKNIASTEKRLERLRTSQKIYNDLKNKGYLADTPQAKAKRAQYGKTQIKDVSADIKIAKQDLSTAKEARKLLGGKNGEKYLERIYRNRFGDVAKRENEVDRPESPFNVSKHPGHPDQSAHGKGGGGLAPHASTRQKLRDKAKGTNAGRSIAHGDPEKNMKGAKKLAASANNKDAVKNAKRKRPKFPGAATLAAYQSGVKKSDADLTLEVPISKRDDDKRLVFGWAYVPVSKSGEIIVDRQGDSIRPEVLEKAAYDYVVDHRAGGVMHSRTDSVNKSEVVKVSDLVESVVFDNDKLAAMGLPENSVPPGSWWVGYRVHNDEVWKGVRDGRYRAFSIHGSARRVPVGDVAKNEAGATGGEQAPQSAPSSAASPQQQPTAPTGPASAPTQRTPGKLKRKVTTKFRPVKPETVASQMKVLAGKGK